MFESAPPQLPQKHTHSQKSCSELERALRNVRSQGGSVRSVFLEVRCRADKRILNALKTPLPASTPACVSSWTPFPSSPCVSPLPDASASACTPPVGPVEAHRVRMAQPLYHITSPHFPPPLPLSLEHLTVYGSLSDWSCTLISPQINTVCCGVMLTWVWHPWIRDLTE